MLWPVAEAEAEAEQRSAIRPRHKDVTAQVMSASARWVAERAPCFVAEGVEETPA